MQLFSRKSEKKRNFLPKYFADTENCRTFASQSRNKGCLIRQKNPYIKIACSLKYLHVSVMKK